MARRTSAASRSDPSRAERDPAGALYGLLALLIRGATREMSLTSQATLATLERTGPRRITDLAVTHGITQPSMTVLVTALERSGYVERHSDPTDRRVTLVVLAAAGSVYIGQQRDAGKKRLAELITELPPEEAATLTAATSALIRLIELDDQRRDGPR